MTGTVLVVDDVEQNVKLLEAKLLSEYYTVLTARNGIEALEVLENNKIDIVLLDVMMPEMDGFETCERIKANDATTHIPVVMVTALSEIEDRVKGLEAGADEFLTKPINDAALFVRVRSLTRMKAIIDELKLRNKTNEELGKEVIKLQDNFSDNNILLVDDDVIQAKNIKSYLSDLTNNIKLISSIEQLDDLNEFIPDVIIISCQLETDDPLRMAVILRSKPAYKKSIYILLAEEENSPIVSKGMEIGINDYFLYPVDKSELLARVKTQLRKQKYQRNLRTELEESVDLSTKDGLTGVFNRRYFDIHLQQMVEKGNLGKQQFCLLMTDMDHFKKINDTYGHQAGDAVIRTLSATLQSIVRMTDLIARYGGEEFAIILGNIELDMAQKVAEKIRKKIANLNFVLPGQKIAIKNTISIGVSEFKENDNAESIIERADKALYKAKENGRNKVELG